MFVCLLHPKTYYYCPISQKPISKAPFVNNLDCIYSAAPVLWSASVRGMERPSLSALHWEGTCLFVCVFAVQHYALVDNTQRFVPH